MMNLPSSPPRDGMDGSTSSLGSQDHPDNSDGKGVDNPGEHDLLLGRGGETNSHPGNIKFRRLIEEYRSMYLDASRRDKPEIAKLVVVHWRGLSPPGRFLAKRTTTSSEGETARKLWYEVSDEQAKKRASKSLGEKQKVTALPTKESFTQYTAKPNTKTRLRNLEARAARNDVYESPTRKERTNVSFPVAQAQAAPTPQSFLYQAMPREMPPLQHGAPGDAQSFVASMISSANNPHVASFNTALNRIYDIEPNHVPSLPSTHANNPTPLSSLPPSQGNNPIVLSQLLSPTYPLASLGAAPSALGMGIAASINSSVAPLAQPDPQQRAANLAPLNTEDDVPTAAELTDCWDE